MVEAHNLPPDAPVWVIDGVPAYLVGTQPRPQPGEPATYEIAEAPLQSDTLQINTRDHVERYLALRDRARYANSLAVETTATTAKTIYSFPARLQNEPTGSPLVAVEPGPYDDTGTAIWGLITGVSDATTLSQAVAQFSLDITFLAEYSEFRDKQAVRDARRRRGFR